MKYALGALASEKFGRFFVTVLFDMFFTARDATTSQPTLPTAHSLLARTRLLARVLLARTTSA